MITAPAGPPRAGGQDGESRLCRGHRGRAGHKEKGDRVQKINQQQPNRSWATARGRQTPFQRPASHSLSLPLLQEGFDCQRPQGLLSLQSHLYSSQGRNPTRFYHSAACTSNSSTRLQASPSQGPSPQCLEFYRPKGSGP